MRLKYIGDDKDQDVTDGVTYIATVCDPYYYFVFDDSGDYYMYTRENPRPLDGSGPGGRWEIVDDMDEREKDIDQRFRNMKDGEYNSLMDECVKICEEYAVKYGDEINEIVEEGIRRTHEKARNKNK